MSMTYTTYENERTAGNRKKSPKTNVSFNFIRAEIDALVALRQSLTTNCDFDFDFKCQLQSQN